MTGEGILAFIFPDSVTEMLTDVLNVQDSLMFNNLWKKYASEERSKQMNKQIEDLSLQKVYKHVWLPTLQKWKQIQQDIFHGTISIENIVNHFKNFKEKQVLDELEVLCKYHIKEGDGADLVTKRKTQVRHCLCYQNDRELADVFVPLKTLFHLSGNFTSLEDIVVGNLSMILLNCG